MKQQAHIIQKTARFFIKPHKQTGCSLKPSAPAVILIRHNNLRGPIHAFLSLEKAPRIWVLDRFLDIKACYGQYRDYTFSQRKGKKPKRFSLKAAMAAGFVVPLMKAIGAVPVYRGKHTVGETLKQSVELLKQGETIVIAVDKAYNETHAPVSSIYTGFFRLEQSYFNTTGEHLPFYALRFNKDRTMNFSAPLYFTGNQPFPKERKQLTKSIIHFLNNETG